MIYMICARLCIFCVHDDVVLYLVVRRRDGQGPKTVVVSPEDAFRRPRALLFGEQYEFRCVVLVVPTRLRVYSTRVCVITSVVVYTRECVCDIIYSCNVHRLPQRTHTRG